MFGHTDDIELSYLSFVISQSRMHQSSPLKSFWRLSSVTVVETPVMGDPVVLKIWETVMINCGTEVTMKHRKYRYFNIFAFARASQVLYYVCIFQDGEYEFWATFPLMYHSRKIIHYHLLVGMQVYHFFILQPQTMHCRSPLLLRLKVVDAL